MSCVFFAQPNYLNNVIITVALIWHLISKFLENIALQIFFIIFTGELIVSAHELGVSKVDYVLKIKFKCQNIIHNDLLYIHLLR